jgi:radical SAM/Cys-rich protein
MKTGDTMSNVPDASPLRSFPSLQRRELTALQVNLGYVCNQTCFHCHVNAGPNRKESMQRDTIDEVVRFLRAQRPATLDLTGGAPELNPHFRDLVVAARALGVNVIDRCNLTILEQPGQEDLAEFLAAHEVQVVASLPCYLEDNVDAQRGDGVFRESIAGLRRLNALGYGQQDGRRELTLVYNPQGASLPPPQASLEAAYRDHLRRQFGVEFTRLFTITNMPINRFAKTLFREGRHGAYMALLREAHRDDNLDAVMCRSLISVDWRGRVYDCDFNQMLGLPLGAGAATGTHLRDMTTVGLTGGSIAVGEHCFGCTAGQGSSCGGALA